MSKCFEVKLLVELQGGEVGDEAAVVNEYITEVVNGDNLQVLDSSIRTIEGKELQYRMYELKF